MLRTTPPGEFLNSALSSASPAVAELAGKLFDFESPRKSHETQIALCEVARATVDEVRALTSLIAPSLADAVALAWQRLEDFTIAFVGWTIGEPALVANRSIWLRDLLRELARFELPDKRNEALLWLAIHYETFAEPDNGDFAKLLAELLCGARYNLGTTGSDHIGRLLASEIAQNKTVSDDLFDTLLLVGTARHPALPPELRAKPATHVIRALAGCGRDDAIEALCETITIDRDSPELAATAAGEAAAAAVEVFAVLPDVLPAVLETISVQLTRDEIAREPLARQLGSVLALPPPLLADSDSDTVLLTCAEALRNEERRLHMLTSDGSGDLFLACWAEAALNIQACVTRLLERYNQACLDGNEDTKLLLRKFARLRDGQKPVMRPMWLRILRETLGDGPEQLNGNLLAEAFEFGAASGLTLEQGEGVPADDALDLLVEIESRLRNKARMAELIKTSSMNSADDIISRLVRLIVLNLAGRPGDALLPFIDRLDCNSVAPLADADLTKTNKQQRAALFERSSAHYPHGPKLMLRTVAAAESIDELRDWLQTHHRTHRNVDPLFAIGCALRPDRLELWRALLLATKKDLRQLGLQFIISALKVVESTGKFAESKISSSLPPDSVTNAITDTIRRDAALVFDEYAAAQTQKKNGDNLEHYLCVELRELARSEDDIENEATESRAALARLCERVAEMTGIDRTRFIPSPVQPPQDRGTRYADILGQVAPRLIENASGFLTQLHTESLGYAEQIDRFSEWIAGRGEELREPDGSELLRAHQWLVGPGNWQYFDEKVLHRAQPLMSATQLQRMAELRPPVLNVSKIDSLRKMFQSLRWDAQYNYEELLLVEIDWYESVLANLPHEIRRLGPLAEHSAAPHPPHEQAIAHVYMNANDFLRSRRKEPLQQTRVRQRLWPLFWWAASFGGRVEYIDAEAVGSAISCGQASLGDLVRFLVHPGYAQRADHLVRALKYPEHICLGINADRDREILAIVDAVATICREQEQTVDPTLPPTLSTTWPKLPSPKDQSGVRAILTKYADVPYQTVGRTSEQQDAFADRLRECLWAAADTWTVSEDYFAPHYVKFDVLDAWLEHTTADLTQLVQAQIISEETLLRIALARPLLLRSVLAATNRSDQLEAVIWILFHSGSNVENIAITLSADTGHAALRQPGLCLKQIQQRLVNHYAPEIRPGEREILYQPVEDATIRHSWKRAAIDAHPREALEPWFNALRSIKTPNERKRFEGLLAALDGTLNDSTNREKLESSIKDRPNLALLQLAVLPLPTDHAALITEISNRLAIFERLAVAGRKRKSAAAQTAMRRALDQARRSLADNAGLADPSQLQWISGKAIAAELAEFKRLVSGDYIIQLRLRSDGPQVLVTKDDKRLKSIPAVFKSSAQGKRLAELQKRIKMLQRDTRSVLESAMVEQRTFSPDEFKLMMKHPVVAASARELVFVMPPINSDEQSAVGLPSDVGLPSENGEHLIRLDGIAIAISQLVNIAHPLQLDQLGVLNAWQSKMTDHPPPAFQQLDRAIVRAEDLETVDEGKKIVRHDGVQLASADQAFRILQAHGWRDDPEIHQMCRTFSCTSTGQSDSIHALLADFCGLTGSIGTVEFRDSDWNELAIADVPAIVLSEAIRDIDRTVIGSTQK